MKYAVVGVLACGLSLAACGGGGDNDAGDGSAMETGTNDTGTQDSGGTDSATQDSGAMDSAAPDAATPDASSPDSSTPDSSAPDSSAPDARPTDSSVPSDGGGFMAIAPCTDPSAYVTGSTSVAISGLTYSPACLTVHAGATVTIEASMFHPLQPRAGGSPSNPIPSAATAPAMVTFTTPGFYPYSCMVHEALGMTGVVHVIP